MQVGAVIPLSGRYIAQGRQMKLGLELWARHSGHRLVVKDDESRPSLAASLHARLHEETSFVLGPYGSDSTRAVARSSPFVWNHGAAADDVQRLAGVVSLPTPASSYLVALARACERLRPGARVLVVTAKGLFGSFARSGLEAAIDSIALDVIDWVSFPDAPAVAEHAEAECVLACGSLQEELALARLITARSPEALYGGVAPGLAEFAHLSDLDPEGMIAPVQWHPLLSVRPMIGPHGTKVIARSGLSLDYVGAQAYAAALLADYCHAHAPEDPTSIARSLRTTTFYGAFELDDQSGMQCGHQLCVVRWRGGRQELFAHNAS